MAGKNAPGVLPCRPAPHRGLVSPVVSPENLLPSLARVVRGLSALFWGLPTALMACTRTAVGDFLTPGAAWLPTVSCGLVWFGLRQLAHFQPQERVWTRAVLRAELFAVSMVFLSPFTGWWSRRPDNPFFAQSVLLLLLFSLGFLLTLNHVLQRLAALLPDETLRADMRLFTRVNGGLISGLAAAAAFWIGCAAIPGVPEPVLGFLSVLEHSRGPLVVSLGLLPMALTMTLVWKAKEAIVSDIYRGR